MKSKPEMPPTEPYLTEKEKAILFEEAKRKHPNPMSVVDKAKHSVSELEPIQNWLEARAELMVDRSGINEAIESFEGRREMKIVDIGGGSQHIEREIVRSNAGRNINVVGVDISDYASGRVRRSEEGEKIGSLFGKGENLPIKEKSVEIATAFFTFQELSDKQQQEVLSEMIRIIKDEGKIIIVDELPKENYTKEKIVARAKNILRNVKISRYNLHSEEEWKEFFGKNGLKVVDYREFREDEKEIGEKFPPQFFSYILEKAEGKVLEK